MQPEYTTYYLSNNKNEEGIYNNIRIIFFTGTLFTDTNGALGGIEWSVQAEQRRLLKNLKAKLSEHPMYYKKQKFMLFFYNTNIFKRR